MKANINHFESTLFEVNGSPSIVTRVIASYLGSMGEFQNHDEQIEVEQEIFNKAIEGQLGIDSFLWIGNFLINFSQ